MSLRLCQMLKEIKRRAIEVFFTLAVFAMFLTNAASRLQPATSTSAPVPAN